MKTGQYVPKKITLSSVIAFFFFIASPQNYCYADENGFSVVSANLPLTTGACAWGDFDGDGKLDIAFGTVPGHHYGDPPNTVIFKNYGNGTFFDSFLLLPAAFRRVAWGDYNNDGYPDVLLVGENLVKVYSNEGGSGFKEAPIALPQISPFGGDAIWGDFDADGNLDIAIIGVVGSTVVSTIFRNGGNDVFTDIHAGLQASTEGRLSAIDYNSDGRLDLLVRARVTKIYRNNGNGTFSDIGSSFPNLYYGDAVSEDFDNDGQSDVAIFGSSLQPPYNLVAKLFRNLGNDIFSETESGLPGVEETILGAEDYDRDGLTDLLVTGRADSLVPNGPYTKLFHNDGNSMFSDSGIQLPATYYGCVAWGDYDNDGCPDLFISGQTFTSTNVTKILHNNLCFVASGQVTDQNDLPLSNTTIELAGDTAGSTVTNSAGRYSFTGLKRGHYTITASKQYYTFSSSSYAFEIKDLSGVSKDFQTSQYDSCPSNPSKIDPGVCGCDIDDVDTDDDGTPDCIDACANDPKKTTGGLCGCGISDADIDRDGTPDCHDNCPSVFNFLQSDQDQDGVGDDCDGCPLDRNKSAKGICGCGTPDTDADGDGTPNCNDQCPNDSKKTSPGVCGCGTPDVDTDRDGSLDCHDQCLNDPKKTSPGVCGCGFSESDVNRNGVPDCLDPKISILRLSAPRLKIVKKKLLIEMTKMSRVEYRTRVVTQLPGKKRLTSRIYVGRSNVLFVKGIKKHSKITVSYWYILKGIPPQYSKESAKKTIILK